MCNYVGFCNQYSALCYQFEVIKTTLYVRIYLTHDQSFSQMAHNKDKNIYTYCLSTFHSYTIKAVIACQPVGIIFVCIGVACV